jgi:hypothetical protein
MFIVYIDFAFNLNMLGLHLSRTLHVAVTSSLASPHSLADEHRWGWLHVNVDIVNAKYRKPAPGLHFASMVNKVEAWNIRES